MAVCLVKGQRVDLTRGTSLRKIMIGLGWDTNKYIGSADFDLDASAFLLGNTSRVLKDSDFIFYGNLQHESGAVKHMGDNLTGEGEGDDEQIFVDLSRIPSYVTKIDVTVTIYDADVRRQNFGQVSNAFVRIVDATTDREILRYDLAEDFSVETAVIVGELYRHGNDWKFNAIGSGFRGGLEAICRYFGVDV